MAAGWRLPRHDAPCRPDSTTAAVPRSGQSADYDVFDLAGSAAFPDHRRYVSEVTSGQPPVVRTVGEPQSQGDPAGWLPAPLGQPFDGEDARQRQECLGRRHRESSAAALESALAEPEVDCKLRNARVSDSQVQGVTEYLVGEGVRPVAHSFQKAVNPLDINAAEDRRVDGVQMVVRVGVDAGCKGGAGDTRCRFGVAARRIVNEGRCGPAKRARPCRSRGERFIGISKAGVDQSRRSGVFLTEFGEFPPARREDHRAYDTGRNPKPKHQRNSRAQPQTGLQGEEWGGWSFDQAHSVSGRGCSGGWPPSMVMESFAATHCG